MPGGVGAWVVVTKSTQLFIWLVVCAGQTGLVTGENWPGLAFLQASIAEMKLKSIWQVSDKQASLSTQLCGETSISKVLVKSADSQLKNLKLKSTSAQSFIQRKWTSEAQFEGNGI